MNSEFDDKYSDEYYVRRRNWAVAEFFLSLVELVQTVVVEVKSRHGDH